jgi:hypothetical protein
VKRPFRHTTVPRAAPPAQRARPSAPKRRHERTLPPARTVARIIDTSDHSLLDVIDNLLNQGVVLNADLVLALADVDLVFVRLSALLCAADRILRPTASRRRPSRRAQTKIERQL